MTKSNSPDSVRWLIIELLNGLDQVFKVRKHENMCGVTWGEIGVPVQSTEGFFGKLVTPAASYQGRSRAPKR